MSSALFFTDDGNLKTGLYSLTANQFINFYCRNGNRKEYETAVVNIFDFAKHHRATRIIIGGSFITKKDTPNDLDCLIVFADERSIPTFVDCAQMDNISYDIIYASEQNPNTVDTFIKLMQTNIYGIECKGVVEVLLWDALDPWIIRYDPNDEDFEIIKRQYTDRTIIERNKRRGILVAIHGVNTNAAWFSKFVPSANSQGWIVAPFIYDNSPLLLVNPYGRKKAIEKFRDYINELRIKYEEPYISVVAHSFGTYITAKYIEGFKSERLLPVRFENVVLTGSIINPDYDWNGLIPDKVGRVLNIQAEGDEAVRFMPNGNWKRWLMMDKLCGRSAIVGFKHTSANVVNRPIDLLGHSNIFKTDIIDQIILPYLNANNGMGNRELLRNI